MGCFSLCQRSKYDSTSNMNGNRESRSSNSYDWTQDIQLHGLLYKKPINHQSNKWTKRYFVIKDGFLLYYPDTEKKDLEKRKCLNVHPKGIIPLGECSIEAVSENGQPHAFCVESAEITGKLMLAADSSFERDKWIDMLKKSKRINWKSSKLADELIHQLEEQGLQMAKQKQDYFDQLQSEVMALSDEKEKYEELARVNQELEKEKEKMEKYQTELMEEFEQVRKELEETNGYMQDVEKDREELSSTISQQQENLQILAKEKHKILNNLEEQENQNQTLQSMEEQLRRIEKKMSLLQTEKAETERRLKENEDKALLLEEEKQQFNEQAQELNETIKDLRAQKEMTEAELKEEVMARMDAERKLKEAEESLRKLGVAVDSQTKIIKEDVHQEMVINVKKLKDFFEGLAMEAKIDEDKPMIVKNSIHARKTLQRRAKTNKVKKARSNSLRAKSSNFDEENGDGLAPIRRCVTTVRKNFAQSLNFPIGGGVKLTEEEFL